MVLRSGSSDADAGLVPAIDSVPVRTRTGSFAESLSHSGLSTLRVPMRSRRQSGWFGIAIGLLAAWGCGGPAPVKIAPVSGVVTYKGVPVRDAYVKLFQERCPIVAGGFTDDMGRFTLTSIQTGDGGPVG